MAFGGNDDIQVKVTLDTQGAEQQAKKLKTDTESALKGISNAASSPAGALRDLTKSFVESNGKAAALATQVQGLGAKLAPLAPYAIAGTVAVYGLTKAFQGLIIVAADGDRFGDIAEAFERNAKAAGVLADELQTNLSHALQDTVDSATLMAQANKAFAAGIDPKVFDDLAAAAKRYADATGGDAKQALDQLISGVNSGREALLRKFGTIKDGVLVLDAFTNKTYEAGQANRNVTDVYEQFTASLTNTYNEVARAVNESEALKLVTQAVTSVVSGLASALGGAIKAFIDFTNSAIRFARSELEKLYNGFLVLGELIGQIKSGEMPSLSKATQAVGKQLAEVAKQGEKTDKVLVKLGKSTEGAGKAAKKAQQDLKDALQDSDIGLADMFNLESFALGDTSLRDTIKKALKQVNPIDIVSDLKGVRKAFLDGITGTPEEIAAETKKRLAIFQKEVQKAESELENGRTFGPKPFQADELALGKNAIDLLGIDDPTNALAGEIQGALTGAFSQALSGLTTAALNGDGKAAAQAAGAAIGSVIGAAIGAYFEAPGAGAAVGASIGGFLGELSTTLFGDDTAGTKARKSADKFFADVFDENRLTVLINGKLERISDLIFNPSAGGGLNGAFGAAAGATLGFVTGGAASGVGSQFGKDGPDGFATGTFDDALAAQEAQIRGTFQAVGDAFTELLGLTDDIAGQIGAILFNNVGGSLENLQVLVQATGKSFEELADAIINAALDGSLSLAEVTNDLNGLMAAFEIGLPGIGKVDEALQNFKDSLASGKASRILLDSLRDIGQESNEIGASFQQMAQRITQSLGLGANQVTALLEAMKLAGIRSITDLVNASNAQLLALARNIEQVTQGQAPTTTTAADPNTGYTPASNFTKRAPIDTGGGGGGGSKTNTAAEKAKREREQAFQQVYKLLQASAAYENILEQIQKGDISRVQANKELLALFKEISKETKLVADLQEKLQKAIKANDSKRIADLASRLDEAQKKLEKTTQTAREAQKALKFDLSGVTPLLKDLNQLGVISAAVGVNIEGVTDTLVQGFLRGKLSLVEFNDQLKKSEQLLGKGIPTEIGATKTAFENLISGGLEGGAFSTDAFRDVFSEFSEQFKTQSSEARKKQFAELTKQFDTSRDALQAALSGGPGSVDELRKQFEGAKKALEDFKASPVKAGFEDLRSELEKTFSKDQVAIFFKGLEDSGVTSFDQFENLSNDAVTKILADLQQLGFGFGTTSEEVKKINEQFDKAITDANGGKDVLQAALDTIGKFNEALGILPGSAQAGGGALAALADGFDAIIEKVAQLDGRTFENDVIFNIRTNGTAGEKALLDVLYGDGGGAADDSSSGRPGLDPTQRRRLEELRRRRKKGRLTPSERKEFERLRQEARA